MAKILINNTSSDILISDTGTNILASSSYIIPASDYPVWAASSDIITKIADLSLTVNDGSENLNIAHGVGLIQGSFIKKVVDFDTHLVHSNRLKVDVSGLNSDNIIEGVNNVFFTDERAQDAVGSILTGSSSVDFVYNDTLNTITADVLPAGVDHDSLANLTSGDPHTQYVKDAGTVNDNAVVRYDGTDGRTIQNSQVYITDDSYVGVITATPISELTVQSTRSVSNRGISTLQYSNDLQGGKLILGKARGTPTAPLYPDNGDIIGLSNFKAWDEATNSWANVGYYNVNASEDHSASAKGTNIGFWTTTNGTASPTEKVSITNTGRVVLSNAITLSNTSEAAEGTFRWTGTEAQVRSGSEWKVLGLNATTLTGTSSVSTTSATYSTISGMTTTPLAGTYLLSFNCNVTIGDDTTGDISVFIAGTERTIFTRRVGINAAGLVGAVASMETVFSTMAFITVNGSQVVDIRFRENGGGTLGVTERVLTLIPAARP